MNGNERLNFMSDEEGYPVVMDSECYYVYAKFDQSNGTLMPSTMRVDEVDPEKEGFQKGMAVGDTVCSGTIMCDSQDNITRWLDSDESNGGRQLRTSTGIVKNLVIMVRFADHQGRRLPTRTQVDILYNSRGGDATFAKSGSIRDVYLTNSYGQLDIQSKAYGWVTLPETEAYYAGGVSGLGEKYKEAVRDALDLLQSEYQVDFDSFDANNDGFVDTISLFHSGYAAEWGGTDSSGNSMWDRIWSHRWAIPAWTSLSGVKASTYCTVPALWGTGGSEIGRIGVIAHELGHTLGLPDLYGGNGGLGIGSYGMMGNSWGFTGSQYYPPMFSAWSKIQLGWLIPTTISSSGRYSLQPSTTHRETYKIDLGPQEYLLIENRQPLEYDVNMKQGGLCIWHVDEKADDRNAGFPGEQGWPSNGNHYRVALLQADGNYNLEKGENRGDEYDVFHSGGKNSLGPSRSAGFGPYPNTDAYQDGQVRSTGISIYDIRQSGDRMHFTVEIPGTSTPPPTSLPVPKPTQAPPDRKPREIRTTFVGGNGAAGSMFDVWPRDNIILFGMGIHTSAIETATVEVWTKSGSFQGFETNSRAWTRILSTTIQGLGRGKPTFLELDPLRLPAMQTRAFYVTTTGGSGLRYTNGRGVGRVYASSSEIDVLEGVGKRYPFGSTFRNRQWNGVLQYYVVSDPMMEQDTDAPTPSPTHVPTPPPTAAPVQSNSFHSVETTFVGGTEQAGNMFDILALEDIAVTNFDIHCSVEGPVTVEIYTKSESHVNFENDCSKWTLIARVTTVGLGQGQHTPLPVGSFEPVHIQQFRIRAFYITIRTTAGRGMRYTRGRGRGTVVAGDGSIEVLEGSGTSYACGRFFKNRVWNGVVYYDRRDPTQILPPISTTLSLTTTYAGGKQENGNMFVVTALKDLSIVEMSIHTEKAGEARLEIYTKPGTYDGFEYNPLAWMNIANCTISTQGSNETTPVPSDSFAPIFISAGESKAFYVTLTGEDNMRYTDGEDWGSIALSNDDLEVSKGLGVDYPFETVYQDRIWNGVLKYVLEQDE
jgi:M6 family metalloprotease-like protein